MLPHGVPQHCIRSASVLLRVMAGAQPLAQALRVFNPFQVGGQSLQVKVQETLWLHWAQLSGEPQLPGLP